MNWPLVFFVLLIVAALGILYVIRDAFTFDAAKAGAAIKALLTRKP